MYLADLSALRALLKESARGIHIDPSAVAQISVEVCEIKVMT